MNFHSTLFHWQFSFNPSKSQEAKLKNQDENKYFFSSSVKNI